MKKIIMMLLCFSTGTCFSNEQDLLAEALKLIAEIKPKIKTPADIFKERLNHLENIIITENVELSTFKNELIKFLNGIQFTPEGELELTNDDKKAAWEFFYGTQHVSDKVLKKAVGGYAGITPNELQLNYPDTALQFLWLATILLGSIDTTITAQKNNIYNQPAANILQTEMLSRKLPIHY